VNGKRFIRLKGCGMWLPENNLPFPGITFLPLPKCAGRQINSSTIIPIETDELRGVGLFK
jgi:hypothetical protein